MFKSIVQHFPTGLLSDRNSTTYPEAWLSSPQQFTTCQFDFSKVFLLFGWLFSSFSSIACSIFRALTMMIKSSHCSQALAAIETYELNWFSQIITRSRLLVVCNHDDIVSNSSHRSPECVEIPGGEQAQHGPVSIYGLWLLVWIQQHLDIFRLLHLKVPLSATPLVSWYDRRAVSRLQGRDILAWKWNQYFKFLRIHLSITHMKHWM